MNISINKVSIKKFLLATMIAFAPLALTSCKEDPSIKENKKKADDSKKELNTAIDGLIATYNKPKKDNKGYLKKYSKGWGGTTKSNKPAIAVGQDLTSAKSAIAGDNPDEIVTKLESAKINAKKVSDANKKEQPWKSFVTSIDSAITKAKSYIEAAKKVKTKK